MPNWKKVIVSGSDAALNSLNVTSLLSVTGSSNLTGSLNISGSASILGNTGTTTFYTNADTLIFTGSVYLSGSIYQTGSLNVTSITSSLFGTASWAQNAITSSHAVNALSASYALTASFALNGGGGGGAITYHQTASAVTWSVPHSLNTYTPIVQVYDEAYNQLIPASVSGSSLTTVQITFSTAIAGYAVLSTGGSVTINISGSNATLVQSTPATTWSFYHGLNETYPVFTIFDNNDDVIVPLKIHADNANTASIYFTTARTGTAVAANCGLSGSTFESASWAATASYFAGTIASASYATTASFSQTAQTSSYSEKALILENSSAKISSSIAFLSSGSHKIYNLSYFRGAMVDYVVNSSGSNTSMRAGTFTATWNATSSVSNESMTMDIGNTDVVQFSADNTGSIFVNISSGNWEIDSLYRALGVYTPPSSTPTGSARYFYLENTGGSVPSSAACSSTTPLLNVVFLSSASMCSVGIVEFTSDTSLAPSTETFWLYDSIEKTVRGFGNASTPPFTLSGPCFLPCGGTFANTINVSSTDVCSTVDTSFFVTGNGLAGNLCECTEFVGAGFASLPSGTYTIKIPFGIDKVTVTTNGTNIATNITYPNCPAC